MERVVSLETVSVVLARIAVLAVALALAADADAVQAPRVLGHLLDQVHLDTVEHQGSDTPDIAVVVFLGKNNKNVRGGRIINGNAESK